MEQIYAYHIANISNLNSIATNGLVPSIGDNSRKVHESYPLIYFTTSTFLDKWIERFNFDKDKMVILKFLCSNYGNRPDEANDYYTDEIISPSDIEVVGDKEESLLDYYQNNKDRIELELEKSIIGDIKILKDRLQEIKHNDLTKEDGWVYHETEPNIVKIIDLLVKIRDLKNKTKYRNLLEGIIYESLEKLLNNDLGITKDSEIYKAIKMIYVDSMTNNHQLDIMSLNYLTELISVNLYLRQLDRYKRTGKKMGDDNTIWMFDSLNFDEMRKVLKNNNLLEEVILLKEEMIDSKKI